MKPPAPEGAGVGGGASGGEAPNVSCIRDRYPSLDDNPLRSSALRTSPLRSSAEQLWSIPGTTKQKDEHCGDVLKWIACSRDPTHWKQPLVEHCDRVECPVCWTYWAAKQSKRMAGRLRGYVADAQERLIGYDWHKANAQNLRHWTFSPKDGVIPPDMDYDRIKQIGKKIIERAGSTGGVFGFHPFRVRPDIQIRLHNRLRLTRLSSEDKEIKFWEAARLDLLDLGSWREYVYWSPHFHVAGFGFLQDARTFHSETGWVYKLIRNVNIKKERTPDGVKDDIASLCFYILSHSGYQWTKKIPCWFGCCTPNNLKKKGKEVPSEFDGLKIVCPKCQAAIVEYSQDLEGNIGEKKLSEEGEEIYRTIKDTIQRYEIIKEHWNEERKRRKKRAPKTA